MANKFPEIKEKNQGKFTKWVNAVMAKKDDFSEAVVKMANYAKNFGCKSKGGPKQKSSDKDPSGDGKYTKKDFLINIGVLDKDGNKIEKKKK